jgi:glycerophosphoryl diester phosphodiesterase
MTKKEIEKKQDGIKNMFFDQSVDVVELDATLSKDEVTTLILDKISHKLTESK